MKIRLIKFKNLFKIFNNLDYTVCNNLIKNNTKKTFVKCLKCDFALLCL